MFKIILTLINFLLVCGQSPCPEYFEYSTSDYGPGGIITVPPFGKVRTVDLEAKFTIAARLPSNYAINLKPIGSEFNLLDNFNRGTPLKYEVVFPSGTRLPKLVELSVNNNVFCYGSGDNTNNFDVVTTITLQHTLFYKTRPSNFYNVPISKPTTFNIPKEFTLVPSQQFDNGYLNKGDDIFFTHIDKPNTGSPSFLPEGNFAFYNRNPQPVYTRLTTEPPVTIPTQRVTIKETTTEAPRQTPKYEPRPRPVESGASSSNECGINSSNEPVPLVIKGFSYDRGEWPWLVALYKSQYSRLSYICAGSLVSNQHIITAAHCMKRKTELQMKNLIVKAGVYNLDDWTDIEVRKVVGAAIHESYNVSSLENDILMLTVDKIIPFGEFIKPVCLWNGDTDQKRIIGASGVVAGWGATENSQGGVGEPLMVRMPVVSTQTCRASRAEFHRLTSESTLCAGDRKGAGPCLGDSGGGLYILDNGRWRLRGIVSKSLPSDDPDLPCNLNEYIIFTDTAQYLPWIKKVMSESPV